MYKLVSIYTLLYLFLTFTSQLFRFSLVPLIREGYIIFLVFALIVEFKDFKLSKQSMFAIIFIFSCSISYIISPNSEDAMSSLLLYISGPIIFVFLSGLNISEQRYFKFKLIIRYFFIFAVITALLIFPIQKQFYIMMGMNKGRNFINTFRYRADGSLFARMSGLSVHPTTMGFITLSMIIYYWLSKQKNKSFLYIVPFYLTNTRSVLFGVPFAFWGRFSKKKKIVILVLGIQILVFFIILIFNNLSKIDPSALIHFADLFKIGPKLIAGNILPFGLGQGTMSPFTTKSELIHVESDLYIAFIQLGYIGLLSYIVLIFSIGRKLKKDNNQNSKFCYFLLFIVNIGCIVLSYYIVRFISNYLWIELGLYFSYRRNLCEKMYQ